MKIQTLTILLASLMIASCSGGGSSNNDQTTNDPSSENDTSKPNARVTCLLNKLGTLPEDQKKVIELSARAVIACKATEADVKIFLGKRKK